MISLISSEVKDDARALINWKRLDILRALFQQIYMDKVHIQGRGEIVKTWDLFALKISKLVTNAKSNVAPNVETEDEDGAAVQVDEVEGAQKKKAKRKAGESKEEMDPFTCKMRPIIQYNHISKLKHCKKPFELACISKPKESRNF